MEPVKVSFAKRFIGVENLPTRLSEFDVQQSFCLSKDDIAAVSERFRHVCDELEVVIAGVAFPHRIYQFALAHSGWRHAVVFEGGESFVALSTGLQSALWRLGGVPEEHRTDSLSAAFNNLAEEQELTRRYAALCKHYDMRASRCNPGQSQENGSIESRHDSLKTALDQALRLRGSRCFDERGAYEALVETIVARLNARVAVRLVTERATLRSLPPRRTAEYEEVP